MESQQGYWNNGEWVPFDNIIHQGMTFSWDANQGRYVENVNFAEQGLTYEDFMEVQNLWEGPGPMPEDYNAWTETMLGNQTDGELTYQDIVSQMDNQFKSIIEQFNLQADPILAEQITGRLTRQGLVGVVDDLNGDGLVNELDNIMASEELERKSAEFDLTTGITKVERDKTKDLETIQKLKDDAIEAAEFQFGKNLDVVEKGYGQETLAAMQGKQKQIAGGVVAAGDVKAPGQDFLGGVKDVEEIRALGLKKAKEDYEFKEKDILETYETNLATLTGKYGEIDYDPTTGVFGEYEFGGTQGDIAAKTWLDRYQDQEDIYARDIFSFLEQEYLDIIQ